MKLLIATPLYPPDIGGPATYARMLETGLPEHGIMVTVVRFSDVRRLPKLVRHLVYGYRVYREAKRHDAVLALDPVSVGLPASIAARLARKPFLVKVVGDYAWEQGTQRFGITETLDEFVERKKVPFAVRVLRSIQSRVAQKAVRVIVPSEYLKRIVMTWGVDLEKMQVIYNAVSLEEGGSAPSSVRALARPLIVTAGRLVPWKHVEGVIDAVAELSQGSLVIVGEGPERSALEKRAKEKLSGRTLFAGALAHKDLLATLKEADAFVLNSSYEGLSHVLVEATMLHVPVIATRVGGNTEIIEEGKNGWLIPAGDTEALARSLRELPPLPMINRDVLTPERMLGDTALLLSNI